MRVILFYILPLLLPLALYLIWASTNRQKTEPGDSHALAEGPGFWLVIAGFSLMIGGLIYLAAADRGHLGNVYTPSVIENGRIVPGNIQ